MKSEVNTRTCKLERPVFLLGAHKSGTSLLRSLLDGHPSLSVFPRETHFFQYAGYWVDYALRSAVPFERSVDALVKTFRGYLEELQRDTNPFSDSPGIVVWDADRFEAYFRGCDISRPPRLFAAYLNALYYSQHSNTLPSGVRVVEKSVENAEYASPLMHMFPDARCLHIVRNPYATVVALRRMKCQRGYIRLRRIAESLYNSWYYLIKNMDTVDPYLVVRYEDLLEDNVNTMTSVASYLEIDIVDSLFEPTVLGRQWSGNSTSGIRLNGVSTAPLEAWRSIITDFEVHLVNQIAGPIFDRFGYKKLEPRRRSYWPVRGESLHVYLSNRFCLGKWS